MSKYLSEDDDDVVDWAGKPKDKITRHDVDAKAADESWVDN